MKFTMADLKKEIERRQDVAEVDEVTLNKQMQSVISWLSSKGVLERNKVIFEVMVKYIAEHKLKCRQKGLFLFGPVGTGKSFAAKVISSSYGIHLYTCEELEAKYKKSDVHFWEMMQDRTEIIIDDLGTESTCNEYGNKFELMGKALNERHRLFEQYGIRTIVTTNLSGDAIKERYSERIYSRLHQMCECVNASGQDLRRV